MSDDSQVLRIQGLIDRLKMGDLDARDELLARTFDQLTKLARMMLRAYPRVKRWEQTDDIMQGASLRLYRALSKVTPPTAKDYFQFAAVLVRRELLDLARRHSGPHGLANNHESHDLLRGPDCVAAPGDEARDLELLDEWWAFHQAASALPDVLRSAVELVFYNGLTHAEAAEVLGVCERTVKRHWRAAKVALHDALGGHFPGTHQG